MGSFSATMCRLLIDRGIGYAYMYLDPSVYCKAMARYQMQRCYLIFFHHIHLSDMFQVTVSTKIVSLKSIVC